MNMNNQLLHTPEGVRDIYAEECARKLAVEQKIQHVFGLYGYQSIETPVFEFFDIFKKERGSVKAQIDWLKGRKIHIHPSCVNVLKEVQQWKWKKDPTSGLYIDEPVEFMDDAMAALRYSVERLRRGSSIEVLK